MKNRTREFKWAYHPRVDPGWMPANATLEEGWYPGAGFITAHDTVEHLSNKNDWAHELRATGVAVFDVRGVKHRSIDNIVLDLLSFAAHDHKLDAPVNAPALAHKPLAPEHEKRVQAFLTELRLKMDKGMADARAVSAVPPEEDRNSATFVERAEPWVRLGYRGALRVYGDRGGKVGKMLDDIRDAVNANHDDLKPVKGDGIVVSVDTKALTFTVKRTGPEMTIGERKRRFVKERMENTFDGVLAELEALGA